MPWRRTLNVHHGWQILQDNRRDLKESKHYVMPSDLFNLLFPSFDYTEMHVRFICQRFVQVACVDLYIDLVCT